MNGWLTCDDLAPVIGVSSRTIQRWARDRTVPHVRIGRLVRFTPEQVAEIQSAYTVNPEVCINVDQPNPDYRPNRAVVVPMRSPKLAR